MNKLRKARKLSWNDWRILARASSLLLVVEIGLRILPFRTMLGWAQKRRAGSGDTGRVTPERTAWLVEIAARYGVYGPTCLRKSLALCTLLSRQGRDARLVIGANSDQGQFGAHAWVELDGKILGARGSAQYHELVAFENVTAERQVA